MQSTEIVCLSLMMVIVFGKIFFPIRFLSNKYISRILIPSLLFLLWIVLIIHQAYIIENVFTILTDTYASNQINELPKGEMLNGQKITGDFTANEDYLGIIGFRFWTFYRLNSDYIKFQIREKGETSWYYSNQHKADQFQPDQYFTFGFPTIVNSKGKHYEYEISSTKGASGNAVGVSSVEPVLIVKYKYPRTQVSLSVNTFIQFCWKKLINISANSTYSASSFIYLLPFLLYVIFISKFKKNYTFYEIVEALSETLLVKRVNQFTDKLKWKLYLSLIRHSPTKYHRIKLSAYSALIKDTHSIQNKIKLLGYSLIIRVLISISSYLHNLAKYLMVSKKRLSLMLCCLGLIIDILYIRDGSIAVIVLLYIFVYTFVVYKISYQRYFIIALICLAVSAPLLYYSSSTSSDRAGAWAWIFFTLWIVSQIWTLSKSHSR